MVNYIGKMEVLMKINGKLVMNFGPVGCCMAVDNISNTTVMQNGKESFQQDSDGSDCFDRAGWWITPEWLVGDEFSLFIPSGQFSGRVISIEKKMEEQTAINGAAALGQVHEHEAQEMQVITVEGQWNGKQGGINSYGDGGLCGLGTFYFSEIHSVEGTFGRAKNLAEYNARAERYRAQYWSRVTDEKSGAVWFDLTEKGEAQLRQYLNQFELDLNAAQGHSLCDWGTTAVEYALATVKWQNEHNGFIGTGLSAWVRVDFTEIPCLNQKRRVDFGTFRQWLDLQFPRLNRQLEQQTKRYRDNPTEHNARRLARYQAAFAV